MDKQLRKEDLILQIRDKLRKDNIKLWLHPYYNESTNFSSDEDLKTLSEDYSASLNLPFENCYETIKELQTNSLENLKQTNHYNKSGLATLKIKILHQNSPACIINKEISLLSRVIDLKQVISSELAIDLDRLKLICSGKVLDDFNNLVSQGVKNGQQILTLVLTENPRDSEKQFKELEAIKKDSCLLALDNEYMQLEDQFGNAVKIPKEEKKALIVAMALHEKGRAALKKSDFVRALVFLLEADQEFRQCNSKILDTVDNYALLDLDIAWCYLNLQSVANLPEAYERLKRCEERFNKTYGPNMERLIAVKGATGNEASLFMRLHLLQGIVLYHRNRRQEALQVLKKAQDELNSLKIDDNSLLLLIELGYTTAEARLGLRATLGDVNRAANYIKENRDKRSQTRKKALAEEILQKERLKLGKCADGKQYVDPNFVKILVNMGYNKEASRIALAKSNNIISDSVQYIAENPLPGPSHSKSAELMCLVEDLAPELQAAGFDLEMAKQALKKHMGDIMKAVDELLLNSPNTSNSESKIVKKELIKKMKKDNEKEEAYKRLAEDIPMVDDDHLDLTLEQEENFLKQYLSLLE